jgi:16S rRNA processing protein RimM
LGWVVIGKFGRPHGIKGWITVISFTELRENILNYQPWYVNGIKLDIINNIINNKHMLVQIKDHVTLDLAAKFTNIEIVVPNDTLPILPNNQYYWHQLLDMQVINTNNEFLGQVIEIIPTGTHDVLVISGEQRYLIPYLPDQFILKVDLNNKVITTNWERDF